MRNEPNRRLDEYRRAHPVRGNSTPGENWGYFEIRRGARILRAISSGVDDLNGWEHVSVSFANGDTPAWDDMAFIKRLWWHDDETVVQFHPKASEYVNCAANCLHLWKKVGHDHELPPSILVGPKEQP